MFMLELSVIFEACQLRCSYKWSFQKRIFAVTHQKNHFGSQNKILSNTQKLLWNVKVPWLSNKEPRNSLYKPFC